VIAIFRVIYIGQVDLATNITGTMPTTVLLFALEPNLAICKPIFGVPQLDRVSRPVFIAIADLRLYSVC
jgi:hypothetical protein